MKQASKDIEKKYYKLDEPILNGMAEIISGTRPLELGEIKDPEKYLEKEEAEKVGEYLAPRKINSYWSKCLMHSSIVKGKIGTNDDMLLQHIDTVSVRDEEGTDNFTIVFKMEENPYIENDTLEKKFYLKNDEPVKCEATTIVWKGKNLCMKEVKKKQKNKKTGQQRVVTKTVETKSFFNFFRTIEGVEKENLMEANEETL